MRVYQPKLFVFISALLLLQTNFTMAQLEPVGMFEHHEDIGNPKIKGSVVYNSDDQTYTVSAGGINMWATTDQFHFLWKKIKGDFMITATVRFIGKGTDPHRKIGIIAREKLTPDSKYTDACVHGDGLTSLQFRNADAAATEQIVMSSFHPTDIELQRISDTLIFSAATFGENYKSVKKIITLNEELYAGLFICSHNGDVTEKAVFSNVRIIIPPAKGYTPYRDYLGSHIELMDVQTGARKIVYSATNSLQAPNWTRDGKYLIYNSDGLLYKFDIAAGKPTLLNTGPIKNNNNDHAISFDGKQIAMSDNHGEKRISTIFTMPINGSDNPIQMTSVDSGHSYFHGWSPDGKKLLFTGRRNNQFDVWSIDIVTKKETALTNLPTLDDGPEYTPDGKWIYFNSVRTGTMKIWRMKPDGSNQEQVTFDEYNDWFPHISPDGKWIVFIAFPKEIDPSDHPFYKKVYLKLMPASGGVPKTIAYLFGGQGTINVPSWSPDSKKIAFVSNTKL